MRLVEIRKAEALLGLSPKELVTLNNAMNETLEALPDWELETRMGLSKVEMLALLASLGGTIESMNKVAND